MEKRLKVSMGNRTVGTLSVENKNENYRFEYDTHWLKNGFEIATILTISIK